MVDFHTAVYRSSSRTLYSSVSPHLSTCTGLLWTSQSQGSMGMNDGECVGRGDGRGDGSSVGEYVGAGTGVRVGSGDGTSVGVGVGSGAGAALGSGVGVLVGA